MNVRKFDKLTDQTMQPYSSVGGGAGGVGGGAGGAGGVGGGAGGA